MNIPLPADKIRDEAQYLEIRAIADNLADKVGDDQDHPLYSKFSAAMDLMFNWEEKHVQIPSSHGVDVLRYLMDAHKLTAADLPEVGSNAVLNDILSGEQPISPTASSALAARFGVAPETFL